MVMPFPDSGRMKVCLVAQPCLTLCNIIDCSPPGSSVHEIPQARLREWVAISFLRESSRLLNWTHVSCIAHRFFTTESPGEPQHAYCLSSLFCLLVLRFHSFSKLLRSTSFPPTSCSKVSSYICNAVKLFYHLLNSIQGSHDILNELLKFAYIKVHSLS